MASPSVCAEDPPLASGAGVGAAAHPTTSIAASAIRMAPMVHRTWGAVHERVQRANRCGFAGGLWMRDAGSWHFGARDYDPRVGRWTTKDPILVDGGDKSYMYATNDLVNRIDPSGTAADRGCSSLAA